MGKLVGAFRRIQVTAKTAEANLLPSEEGIIDVQTDGIYMYLPTYIGNEGTIYYIKATATFSAGVGVYGYDTTENIDGDNLKVCAAQYDALMVIAHSQGWHILSKIGTWS